MRTQACILALLFAASSPVLADGNLYIEGRGGLSFFDDQELDFGLVAAENEFDTGFAFQGAAGLEHSSGLRPEFSLGYQEADVDDIDFLAVVNGFNDEVEAVIGMASLYYDLDLKLLGVQGPAAKLTPFAGGGLGLVHLDLGGGNDDLVFGYNIGFGVSYDLNENFALSFQYMYIGADDPDFGGVEGEFGSQNLTGGLRFRF